MNKIALLFFLSALFILTSAKFYSSAMTCGPCKTTTGCTGNMCLILTGDTKGEYCYGSATCGFQTQENISLGLCSFDYSGGLCPSGLCMAGLSASTCYSTSSSGCITGVSFK